jgi:Kef-type K+ transport system membrane component KefB
MHAGAAVDPIAGLALGLALLLVAAKVAGHVAIRLGAPAVLGELVVGILLGNLAPSGFVHDLAASSGVETLARLGVMILVFEVGLELTLREVLDVGVAAIMVAVLGTSATFALGWAASRALLPGAPSEIPIFLGAALTATSIGISARVLKDLGRTRTREARIIIGAAVVDDVIGLVVLTVVSGWILAKTSGGGGSSASAVAIVAGKSVAFLGVAIFVGSKVAP